MKQPIVTNSDRRAKRAMKSTTNEVLISPLYLKICWFLFTKCVEIRQHTDKQYSIVLVRLLAIPNLIHYDDTNIMTSWWHGKWPPSVPKSVMITPTRRRRKYSSSLKKLVVPGRSLSHYETAISNEFSTAGYIADLNRRMFTSKHSLNIKIKNIKYRHISPNLLERWRLQSRRCTNDSG